MKFSKKCPKCASTKIGFLEASTDRPDTGTSNVKKVVGVAGSDGDFKGAKITRGDLWGTLEAYVCTECGYWEEYVKRPEHVPFEHLRGFRWVNLDPQTQGPFR